MTDRQQPQQCLDDIKELAHCALIQYREDFKNNHLETEELFEALEQIEEYASHSSASEPAPEPGGAPNVSCDNDPCQFCFDGWCSFKCRKWDALVQTAATKARAEVLDALEQKILSKMLPKSHQWEPGMYIQYDDVLSMMESLRGGA